MKTRPTILAFSCVTVSAFAVVSFGPVKNYPNLGFEFPCLENAIAEPLSLPQAHPYLTSDTEYLIREDRFDPFERWYGLQCCGRWRNARGQTLTLGRIANRLPLFSDNHVSRPRFEAALADDSNLVDPRNMEHIDEWVATFIDKPVHEPEKLKLNAFSLDELRFYPCEATNTLIYAFRPRQLGSTAAPDWFCVRFEAPGEKDPAALRSRFEELFIGQISLPNRTSKGEGAEAVQLDVSRKGMKATDQPNHPVRIEARTSIENYDTWWYAETDGYIILSDVATEVGKSVIRDLQDTMPALRQAYARLVPPLTSENDISLIRIFQSKDDYVRHVGKDHAWTAAVWMPGRRELVLTQESNKDEIMGLIRHESFHQYLSYAYCMLAAAPWLNEGHACLFESARVDAKGKVNLDEDPTRSQLLLENLGAVTAALPALIQADYEAFYGGEMMERRLKYAAVWGLAYYLQKGAPLERNTPFKSILPDFAASLAATHSYQAATSEAFKKIDVRVFQDNFREFWLKRRASAIHYDPLDK
jgi:hypothetical protein